MLRVFLNATAEAIQEISARPLRAFLAVLAMTLSVSILVASVGIASSGRLQIDRLFDLRRPQEIVVSVEGMAFDRLAEAATPLRTEPGVRAVGMVLRGASLFQVAPATAGIPAASSIPLEVVGVDAGALTAMRSTMTVGDGIASWQVEHRVRVAVLGDQAARSLGVVPTQPPESISINRVSFSFGGIVAPQGGSLNAPGAVYIPWAVVSEANVSTDDPQLEASLLVWADPALTQQVAARLPLLISPIDPTRVDVLVQPFPESLQEQIETEVSTLGVAVAAAAAIIGALSMANSTLVSVVERTRYIGIQRSLGAGRADIVTQVMAESALLGALAGALGSGAGAAGAVWFAVQRQWPPAADVSLLLLVVAAATLLGVVAGILPALRAAGISPAQAIRNTG